MRWLVVIALVLPPAALAGPEPVASFDDPPGDATGPGSYTPPLDSDFQDGDFDLRRFAVLTDGDDVVFEVTLGAQIRRPETTHRTNLADLQLLSGIYLQNIDIYIDRDRATGQGFTACIPGRRVAFPEGQGWEAAVVLTPQPGPARSVTESALGSAVASHIVFVDHVESRGRTLVARVPALALGGKPRKDWGWSVHVSGASWERNFAVMDRLRSGAEANAFTLPVLPVPEAYAFGGAPENGAYPRVLDVLTAPGADQRAILGAFAGGPARVPFVYAERPPLVLTPMGTAVKPPEKGLVVADIVENMISISGPVGGVRRMQIGKVLGSDGATVAHVIVVQILEGGLLTQPIDNKERIVRGAKVVFSP